MPKRLSYSNLACLLLIAASPATAMAEHPVAEAQTHLGEAIAAYRAGDYEAFTASLERAYRLNPASLPTRYNLACGYVRTGREDAALDLLEALATAGVDFGMAEDPDLASLADRPRFRSLLETLAENTAPILRSTEWLTVDRIGLIPEGIAGDSGSGRVFFGSMRTGEVFATDNSGSWSRFASVADESPLAAVGMTVDVPRNLLWVVGSRFPGARGFDPESPPQAGLFGFDLDSGEPKHRFLAGPDVSDLNDVALAPSGDIYVSGNPLQVLEAGTGELRSLETEPALFGGNGLALSPDGRTLFVASYPVGVAAVDLGSGRARVLEAPARHPLYGIDGLYWHDGALLGIQNGIRPWRVLRIMPASDLSGAARVEVLERGNPAFVPTTGTVGNGRLMMVGQAPAVENPPPHFPAGLAPFAGGTVIMEMQLPRMN